jgi:hypothetical protein
MTPAAVRREGFFNEIRGHRASGAARERLVSTQFQTILGSRFDQLD